MQEAEVVRRVHGYLRTVGLDGHPAERLYTDAHPTLTGIADLKPFHRFVLDYGGFAVHPDLVGQLADGESLFAVEAKGRSGVVAGVNQAEMYQRGVQRTFLAAPARSLSDAVVAHARSRGVGVLSVGEQVSPVYMPEARMPLFSVYKALLGEFACLDWVTQSGTFTFNLPTHYLIWPVALDPGREYGAKEAVSAVGPYKLPANGQEALRGAQKLGLVRYGGGQVWLTEAGGAVKDILQPSLVAWAELHQRLASAHGEVLLHHLDRVAAGVLRLLLLQDPVVRLVHEGLERLPGRRATFDRLALSCAGIDAPKAAIFFLKPEVAASRAGADGHVDWARVEPQDYRSTSFFQFKSVLRHAGVLSSGSLGGASSVGYRPVKDVWALA